MPGRRRYIWTAKKSCFKFTFLLIRSSVRSHCMLYINWITCLHGIRFVRERREEKIVDEWLKESINHKNPQMYPFSLLLSWFAAHYISFSFPAISPFFRLWKDADQQNPINLLESWTLKRRMYVQHKTQYLLSSFHHQIHHINKIKSTCRETKWNRRVKSKWKCERLKICFQKDFPSCLLCFL